ncbi:ketopantoate reductase family protein [Roseateles sp. P5_E11]
MNSSSRVCVVGPGAIGGLLASDLLDAGVNITLLASERRAAQIHANGLVLLSPDGMETVRRPVVSAHAGELGQQDVVFLCTKGTGLPALAPSLAPLIGPDTSVVSLMNGVPWWFFHGLRGDARKPPRLSIDPDGATWKALPPAQCLGCVVHLSSALDAAGRVVPGRGRRLIVGAPTPESSARVQPIAAMLGSARFEVTVTEDIHREIWTKLWGNLTMNPTSALTLATADRLLDEPLTRRLIEKMMVEAREVGERLGISLGMSIDDRIASTRLLGAFKTSMLQDVEAGRPLEVDAIVRVVHEIAEHVGVAVPFIEAVLGLLVLRAAPLSAAT